MPACRRRDSPYWLGLRAHRRSALDVVTARRGLSGRDFAHQDFTHQDFTWRSTALRLEEGTAEIGLMQSFDVMMQGSSVATPANSHAVPTALMIALIGAAAILGAYYFQFVVGLAPCPLCLEQRIPYYIGIPLALVVAFVAFRKAPARLVALGFVLLAIVFLVGAGLGVFHAGIEWKFWPGPTECSGPLGQFGGSGGLLEQMETTSLVRCDEAAWRFMGISLAGYNVLISLFIAAESFAAARRLFRA